jgi:23S rRNA (guanosine2251-2'-O)-methyltransferase
MADVIYGRWASLETIRAARRTINHVLLAEGIEEKGVVADVIAAASQRGLTVKRTQRRMMDDLVKGANHQGIILRTSDYPYVTLEEILVVAKERGEKPFVLLLDLLQDPQNVGTLLRTAEAVGVHGVVMQDRRSVGITGAVVNASSGASEHLHIAQVTNLVNAMRTLKEENVWLAGLDIGANLVPIDRADLNIALGIVVGSEGEGMRRLVRETCDLMVTLPMRGHVASLNVAMAGAVALYSAWQARGWDGWVQTKSAANSPPPNKPGSS